MAICGSRSVFDTAQRRKVKSIHCVSILFIHLGMHLSFLFIINTVKVSTATSTRTHTHTNKSHTPAYTVHIFVLARHLKNSADHSFTHFIPLVWNTTAQSPTKRSDNAHLIYGRFTALTHYLRVSKCTQHAAAFTHLRAAAEWRCGW